MIADGTLMAKMVPTASTPPTAPSTTDWICELEAGITDEVILDVSMINHTLLSTIRAVISTITCTSMASNSTSDSECYLAVRAHVRVLLLP